MPSTFSRHRGWSGSFLLCLSLLTCKQKRATCAWQAPGESGQPEKQLCLRMSCAMKQEDLGSAEGGSSKAGHRVQAGPWTERHAPHPVTSSCAGGPSPGRLTLLRIPMASAGHQGPSCGCQPVAANCRAGERCDCQSSLLELGSSPHQGQLFHRQFVIFQAKYSLSDHIAWPNYACGFIQEHPL